MKILFVCKHNRFRSKVAEAIFNKLNKNKKIIAKSAGVSLDKLSPYVAESVIKIMKEKSYSIGGVPKNVDFDKINDYGIIVIVADNVSKELFISSGFKKKIMQWKISDCAQEDVLGIRKRIEEIEKKAKNFIDKL